MEGKNDRSCQKKGLMDNREREEKKENSPEKSEDPL